MLSTQYGSGAKRFRTRSPELLHPGDVAAETWGQIAGKTSTSAIGTLAGMGAKDFLVVDVPDLGKTPDAIATGPFGVAAASSAISGEFNSILVPSLATIGGGIDIRRCFR